MWRTSNFFLAFDSVEKSGRSRMKPTVYKGLVIWLTLHYESGARFVRDSGTSGNYRIKKRLQAGVPFHYLSQLENGSSLPSQTALAVVGAGAVGSLLPGADRPGHAATMGRSSGGGCVTRSTVAMDRDHGQYHSRPGSSLVRRRLVAVFRVEPRRLSVPLGPTAGSLVKTAHRASRAHPPFP